jgi:glycosyltransferase involved in cell wall biosynthesis
LGRLEMVKIAHLTSAHPRYDTRIFLKMCKSLSKKYEVYLIVADGNKNEIKDNINIVDVGKLEGRINRIFKTTKKVLKKAIEIDAEIYHLHDPELIPVGLKLKKFGKKVIFDIHENISQQILNKEYINKYLRVFISKAYRIYETIQLKKMNFLILAEYSYLEYYNTLNKNEVVLNMPDIKRLEKFSNINRNKNEIFYIGRISDNRGFDVTIEAIKRLKGKIPNLYMHYIGAYEKNLLISNGTDQINNIKFYGPMPLYEGLVLSKQAKVGLSILKPIGNYITSYSTKVFEYMAIGLPVVTSNFQLYKDVIEKYNCGLCVNPLNPQEIADAIEYILTHPVEARQMGLNGRKMVKEKYNWQIEEKKLFKVYEEVLNG